MPRQSTVQPRTKRGVAVRRKLRKVKLILADSRLHCQAHVVVCWIEVYTSYRVTC